MAFIVPDIDLPKNCFCCPLDHGNYKREQGAFISCHYWISKYENVPTDSRPKCCGLKEVTIQTFKSKKIIEKRDADIPDFYEYLKERFKSEMVNELAEALGIKDKITYKIDKYIIPEKKPTGDVVIEGTYKAVVIADI